MLTKCWSCFVYSFLFWINHLVLVLKGSLCPQYLSILDTKENICEHCLTKWSHGSLAIWGFFQLLEIVVGCIKNRKESSAVCIKSFQEALIVTLLIGGKSILNCLLWTLPSVGHSSCHRYRLYNNYSMSPSWIWIDKITNERVARGGYNHFISNKGEWNNCWMKVTICRQLVAKTKLELFNRSSTR